MFRVLGIYNFDESIKRPKEGRCFDYMLGRAATRGKTGKILPGLCRIERGGMPVMGPPLHI